MRMQLGKRTVKVGSIAGLYSLALCFRAPNPWHLPRPRTCGTATARWRMHSLGRLRRVCNSVQCFPNERLCIGCPSSCSTTCCNIGGGSRLISFKHHAGNSSLALLRSCQIQCAMDRRCHYFQVNAEGNCATFEDCTLSDTTGWEAFHYRLRLLTKLSIRLACWLMAFAWWGDSVMSVWEVLHRLSRLSAILLSRAAPQVCRSLNWSSCPRWSRPAGIVRMLVDRFHASFILAS